MILAASVALFALSIAVIFWITLSNLTSGYEVDNGTVYYRSFNNLNWKVERREVIDAHPETIATFANAGGRYGTDNTSVYYHETQIIDADPQSFQVLDWRGNFSRDANRVYWKSIRITSDPENFQILSRGYSKDTEHVYYYSKIVEDADPTTFVVTGTTTSHARDKNQEYNTGRNQE